MAGGTMVRGGGIPIFQMLAVKGAVKMEANGLKFRGGSVTARWAKILGCKKKDVLARLEEEIKKAEGNLKPGDITAI